MTTPPVNAVRISTTDPDNQTYLLLHNNDRVDIELIDRDGCTLDTIILTPAEGGSQRILLQSADGHLTRVARPATPAPKPPQPQAHENHTTP